MMKALFIAGTDTGVGKTIVTGCLARYLIGQGYNVITQKWMQTGCGSFSSSDIRAHLKIMGRDKFLIKEYLCYAMPYMFKKACSPHLASKLEGKKIDINKIKKSFRFLSKQFDFVIVEGIGGVSVPFSKKRLLIDIVRELHLPVLLVVGNKLGAINHTLLTIEALRARKIKVFGLVFNNIKKEEKYILEDNLRVIKALTKERVFGILPRQASSQKLYEKFIPIAQKIASLTTPRRCNLNG